MGKIERVTSHMGQAERVLNEDELDAVNGGIMIIGGLVTGESRDRDHKEWIEILSYSHG
jgi:hypothetical protein